MVGSKRTFVQVMWRLTSKPEADLEVAGSGKAVIHIAFPAQGWGVSSSVEAEKLDDSLWHSHLLVYSHEDYKWSCVLTISVYTCVYCHILYVSISDHYKVFNRLQE